MISQTDHCHAKHVGCRTAGCKRWTRYGQRCPASSVDAVATVSARKSWKQVGGVPHRANQGGTYGPASSWRMGILFLAQHNVLRNECRSARRVCTVRGGVRLQPRKSFCKAGLFDSVRRKIAVMQLFFVPVGIRHRSKPSPYMNTAWQKWPAQHSMQIANAHECRLRRYTTGEQCATRIPPQQSACAYINEVLARAKREPESSNLNI